MITIVAVAALPALRSAGGRATAKELADTLAQRRAHVNDAKIAAHAGEETGE